MSFSFLGGLASLLPNYVQGQRMANQDNWRDLMNYNQVQSGQLSNLFTEATWQDRLDQFRNSTINSALQTYGNQANARLMEIMRPYREREAMTWNYFANPLADIGALSQLQRWNMLQQHPNLLQTVGGGSI